MQSSGEHVPALANRPQLSTALWGDVALFGEIHDARRHTYGSPLPLSDQDIFSFLCIHDLPDKLALINQIKLVDRAWLHVQKMKQEREIKTAAATSKRKAKTK